MEADLDGDGRARATTYAEPMTCAEAIAQAIGDLGRPMRAAEIADEINRRGLYERADGRPLPSYQVSSIAHANPRRFRIVAGLIAVSAGARPPRSLRMRPIPARSP